MKTNYGFHVNSSAFPGDWEPGAKKPYPIIGSTLDIFTERNTEIEGSERKKVKPKLSTKNLQMKQTKIYCLMGMHKPLRSNSGWLNDYFEGVGYHLWTRFIRSKYKLATCGALKLILIQVQAQLGLPVITNSLKSKAFPSTSKRKKQQLIRRKKNVRFIQYP